jgi:hypothetical protein
MISESVIFFKKAVEKNLNRAEKIGILFLAGYNNLISVFAQEPLEPSNGFRAVRKNSRRMAGK